MENAFEPLSMKKCLFSSFSSLFNTLFFFIIRLAEWVGKEGERKRKRKEELDKKIEELTEGQNKKKLFKDVAYLNQSKEILEQVDDALAQGKKNLLMSQL